jgi:WhiB family redox-sensing transcriptional regulator
MLPERYEYEFDQPGGLEPTEPDRDWWALARCNDLAGTMSGLFFSEELQDIAKAKEICARCPVIGECLEGALERREPWGVWGGQLLLNGKVLQRKRRRGRPPKVARPEDHFPEIPVPEHLRERVVYKSA